MNRVREGAFGYANLWSTHDWQVRWGARPFRGVPRVPAGHGINSINGYRDQEMELVKR